MHPTSRNSLLAVCALLGLLGQLGFGQTTTRVSVSSAGVQGNHHSDELALSADGGTVAFQSTADNLVAGDTNGVSDIFVHDRSTGLTTRVSVGPAGAQANGGGSFSPAVSGDGTLVAFYSYADNLVPGDGNGVSDVFVHDRLTGVTTRVSVSSGGNEGNNISFFPGISANGRFVAYSSAADNLVASDVNGFFDIFVHDRLTGVTTLESAGMSGAPANSASFTPSLSSDGLFVVFGSLASNLVPGDTNGVRDIFVRDRTAGSTRRVSISSAGVEGNNHSFESSISADGLVVAFDSSASNLVPDDTSAFGRDAFVRDDHLGLTERVSVSASGAQGSGFWAGAYPSISAAGMQVAFQSDATNLVAGDSNDADDVFVKNRNDGSIERVSLSTAGLEANNSSLEPALSADGRFVAFYSHASNLVPGDSNGVRDVFVRDRDPSECFLVVGNLVGSAAFLLPGVHSWETQLDEVQASFPVLLDDIPEFVLPTPASLTIDLAARGSQGPSGTAKARPPLWLLDGQFAVQILMWNPELFPGQPEQYSAGLQGQILPGGQVVTAPYGTSVGGLQICHEIDTNAAGQLVIRFPFSIPGF